MVMAPPSTASAGARKLGSPAERCSVEPSFACHGWFARSPHSVGGAECGERASVVWGKPCGSRERRGRRRRRDSTSPHGVVTTTHTTSLLARSLSAARCPCDEGTIDGHHRARVASKPDTLTTPTAAAARAMTFGRRARRTRWRCTALHGGRHGGCHRHGMRLLHV